MAVFRPKSDPSVDPLAFAGELRAAGVSSFTLPAGRPDIELAVRRALYEVDGMPAADALAEALDDRPALLDEWEAMTVSQFATLPAHEVQQTLSSLAAVKALRAGKQPSGSPVTVTETAFTTDADGRIIGKREVKLGGA
jgi:hypothetical protein